MASRINTSSGVTNPVRTVPETGTPSPIKGEGVSRALVISGPQPAPSLAPVPWSSVSGPELYKRVQSLPEGASTGSPEATPKDPDAARSSGIGRKVDRYA